MDWRISNGTTQSAKQTSEPVGNRQKHDGLVRLKVESDECCDLEELLGDYFDPVINTDVKPNKLAEQKQHEIDRINRDGVWGIVGEYLCGACLQWVVANSCWGFIGEDWKGSGYDLDCMEVTLDALATIPRVHA